MTHAIEMLPIAKLSIDAANVRQGYDPAKDDKLPTLAASIANVGLIAPLVVLRKGKRTTIVAGQRRYHALLSNGATEASCVVLPADADATTISFAENYGRVEMTPQQIYRAFAAIKTRNPKATHADIGAAWGYDERRVARIMRLANLAPAVMTAWETGGIDEAEAMAFASTENHALQISVLEAVLAQPTYLRSAHNVRALLGSRRFEHDEAMKLVGMDAYLTAGGRVEEDLFMDNSGRILDTELLEQLAEAKLQAAIEDYTAEFPGTEVVRDHPATFYLQVHPRVTCTDEQMAQIEALDKQIRDLEDTPEPDDLDGEALDAWNAEQQERGEALLDARDAIENAGTPILPDGDIVVVPQVTNNGIVFKHYYRDNDARAAAIGIKPRTTTTSETEDTAKADITQKAELSMRQLRANMVGSFLQLDTSEAEKSRELATDALVFLMARRLIITHESQESGLASGALGSAYWVGGIGIDAYRPDLSNVPGLADADIIEGFDRYAADATRDQKLRCAAAAFAARIDGSMIGVDVTRPTLAAHIARPLSDVAVARQAWTPTRAFFDLFKKTQILEWFGAIHDNHRIGASAYKADELKDAAVQFFTGDEAAAKRFGISDTSAVKTWVPKWLRFRALLSPISTDREGDVS